MKRARVTVRELGEGSVWVKMGPEPHLARCERCGQYIPKPPLPLPIRNVVAYMRGVVAAHALCKEPQQSS